MKMKAGTYYIGDPCYVYGDDHKDWLDFLDYGVWKGDSNVPFEYKGYTCFAGDTKYGDGVYEGSDGFHYPVDAGMIGAIPVEMADKPYRSDLSTIVTFEKDFICEVSNGVICIGHISIDTDPEDDEEDVYDECCICGILLDSHYGYCDMVCEECEEAEVEEYANMSIKTTGLVRGGITYNNFTDKSVTQL